MSRSIPCTVGSDSRRETDGGQREGLTTTEHQEVVRLRRENRILREEREILRSGASLEIAAHQVPG